MTAPSPVPTTVAARPSARLEQLFILSNMREYGGAEKSIATLLPHLALTTRVRIYAENRRHADEVAAIPGVEVVRTALGNSPAAMAGTLGRLVCDCLQRQPSLLLANGHKGALFLVSLRTLLPWRRMRFAIYVRDFDYRWLGRFLPFLPDCLLLAPSQAIFDHPRYRAMGIGRYRCVVIENAVEPPSYEDPITEGEPFIGCCARMIPWKGVDYLIRAFALIAPETGTLRLKLYGEPIDPVYYAGLQSLAAELGLTDRIDFCPATTDIAEVYRRGAFFVVSSLDRIPGPESFGRVVIEAWSHRKPVIAFACGGPRDIIEDGLDGYLVETRNVPELAARMLTLWRDPAARAAMGDRGWNKVRTRFQPERIAAQLLKSLADHSAR